MCALRSGVLRATQSFLPMVVLLFALEANSQQSQLASPVQHDSAKSPLQDPCATPTSSAQLKVVAVTKYGTLDEFRCLAELLDSLNSLPFDADSKRQVSEQLLWSLADAQPNNSTTQGSSQVQLFARSILEKIKANNKDPLQGEAWLATLDMDNLPSAANSARYYDKLIRRFPDDWSSLDDYLAAIHPLFAKRMMDYFVSSSRSQIEADNPQQPGSPISALGNLTIYPLTVSQTLFTQELTRGLHFEANPGEQASASDPWTPIDMTFSLSGTLCTGRGGCGNVSLDKSSNVTGTEYPRGWLDDTGGTSSIASVHIAALRTDHAAYGVFFEAALGSYVRGGYRQGDWTGSVSGEDQKSSVSYELSGTAALPACQAGTRCHRVVQMTELTDPIDTASGDSAVLSVTQGNRTPQLLAAGQPLTIDLGLDSAVVTVDLKHTKTHIGACCEPGWHTQQLLLGVTYPPLDPFIPPGVKPVQFAAPSSGLFKNVAYSDFAGLISKQLIFKRDHPDSTFAPYGEILTAVDDPRYSDFSRRFWGIYARLWAGNIILTHSSFPKTPLEISVVQDANRVLSMRARQQFLPAIKEVLAAYKLVLPLIDIVPLDTAIADLVKGTSLTSIPDLKYIALLSQLSSSGMLSEQHRLEEILARLNMAKHNDSRVDALLALLQFRQNYQNLSNLVRERTILLGLEASALEAKTSH